MPTLRVCAAILAASLTTPAWAQTQLMTMRLPCYPADHAIEAYSREGYAPTQTGVQDDGDLWLLWPKGDAWLLTITSDRVICKAASGDDWSADRPIVPGRDG